MKLTAKKRLIALFSVIFLVTAILAVGAVIAGRPGVNAYAVEDTGTVTCTTASGNYLDNDYVSIYKIPTDMLTYESNEPNANGGLANAFDGNWNSYWQTNKENNGQNSDNPAFLNAITVTFNQAVTVQNILYASSNARVGHGYPVILNVYTDGGDGLALYGTCNSDATDDRVLFTFDKAVTVTKIKFEFRKVNPAHNWTATAKELCFLQPDNASANKVLDLFDDYAQYEVKEAYKASLAEIRDGVKDLISYESALKPLLDRAEAIVKGDLVKSARREFSTDPNAENVITQYGDMRSYARNTLRLSQFGINRQVLGVGGMKGDTITVYVEADEGDPLPSIAFTQVKGEWRSWVSTVRLSLGKNVFTFPDFITSNYSWQVDGGGPIHIVNPYEPSQQSSNVKVYVEGGFLYPVFRKGGDVASFYTELTEYYNEMQETEGTCDVAELVGDHFMNTVSAKRAYNDFVTRRIDPQANAERWDEYLTALLEFDGIAMSPESQFGQYYNEKNLHLYHNFRVTQPWGGAAAFSAGDHIGFIQFGEDGMTNFGVPGWGVAHEIGHSLDGIDREYGETTNNMWAKFELAYLAPANKRDFNDKFLSDLTPDENEQGTCFKSNTYNYQLWWNLEACFKGFWGNLDNTYRYYDLNAARTAAGVTNEDGNLTKTERMVYYSSLVVGEDLGYLYDRFGFAFEADPFKLENATGAYKKLVAKALADGKIVEKGYKYWYIDANHYFYDKTNGGCYDEASNVEISDVRKTSSGYMLLLPGSGNAAHLGYEIMEYRNGNWYVIGFTYSESYTDTTQYESGYVPQYKIRAYDRAMGVSAESAVATFTETSQSGVCRIGETYYNSISEAVRAASAGATVHICKDSREEGVVIDKNLTLLPDPALSGSVKVTRGAEGNLFTVNGGVTFTIGDGNGAKIVLDGSAFSQNGALIRVNGGTLRVNNAELRNNRNTDHGGAVYNTGNSAFTNVTFANNYSGINGGAIANFSGGVVTLTDCILTGNGAKEKGGAITLDGKTTLIRSTVTGNTAGDFGGAMYVSGSNDARSASVEGCEISGNVAGKSGNAIYQDKGIFTLIGGETMILSGEIYKAGGKINVSKATLDLSELTFRLSSVTEGTLLFTATDDLAFTEDFAASLNVESAQTYLGDEDKTVLLKPLPSTVTITGTGTDVQQKVEGGKMVLPDTVEGLGESQFISAWSVNGKLYFAGETVEITGDCDLIVRSIGAKLTVTVKNGADERAFLLKPNETFTLEDCTAPQGKRFSHWDVNGVSYNVGDTVTVTEDTVATAVFEDIPVDGGTQITSPEKAGKDGKFPGWAIGVIVGAIVVLGGAAAAVILIMKRKKGGKSKE